MGLHPGQTKQTKAQHVSLTKKDKSGNAESYWPFMPITLQDALPADNTPINTMINMTKTTHTTP